MGMGAKKIRRAFYGYMYFARPLISLRMFMGRYDMMIFDVLTATWHINGCLFGDYSWIVCVGKREGRYLRKGAIFALKKLVFVFSIAKFPTHAIHK